VSFTTYGTDLHSFAKPVDVQLSSKRLAPKGFIAITKTSDTASSDYSQYATGNLSERSEKFQRCHLRKASWASMLGTDSPRDMSCADGAVNTKEKMLDETA
jgi:hypothetical protein